MRPFKCITMDHVEDSGSVPMCCRSCVTDNVYLGSVAGTSSVNVDKHFHLFRPVTQVR